MPETLWTDLNPTISEKRQDISAIPAIKKSQCEQSYDHMIKLCNQKAAGYASADSSTCDALIQQKAECNDKAIAAIKEIVNLLKSKQDAKWTFFNNYSEKCFYNKYTDIPPDEYPGVTDNDFVQNFTSSDGGYFNFQRIAKLCTMNAGGFSKSDKPQFNKTYGRFDFRISNALTDTTYAPYSHAGANYFNGADDSEPAQSPFSDMLPDELMEMSEYH